LSKLTANGAFPGKRIYTFTGDLPMDKDPAILFREATNADGDKVRKLVFGVLAEYDLQPDPGGTDSDLNDIEKNYARRGGVFEVLEDGEGNLLGTVGLFPIDAETVELRKMYFDKTLRGKGFGKIALERMIEQAKRLGFRRIYLETNSALKEAIGLYVKFGFAPTDETHAARCDQAYILDI
jgi:putative acetyltransferase